MGLMCIMACMHVFEGAAFGMHVYVLMQLLLVCMLLTCIRLTIAT